MADAVMFVQDNFGSVVGANSYQSEASAKLYWDNAGYDYTTPAYSDNQITISLIQATAYMDGRWRFQGIRKQIAQNTAWPRYNLIDVDRNPVNILTKHLLAAHAEYAWIYLTTGSLNPVPVRDPTGARLQAKTTQVGPIMESVRYAGAAVFVAPIYPIADGYLTSRGYVVPTNAIMRG